MSLVQTCEISQGWFTRNSSWQIFCFGGGVLGRIWLVPAKGSQLLQPRTSKGSNFTMVGHGFQALSVAHVLLVLWCGEFASLKMHVFNIWQGGNTFAHVNAVLYSWRLWFARPECGKMMPHPNLAVPRPLVHGAKIGLWLVWWVVGLGLGIDLVSDCQ